MRLAPDQRLQLDTSRDQTISVASGIVCVSSGEDDHVLTPGDSITVSAGAALRAWNGGDEPASVTVVARPSLRLAA